MLRRTDFGGFLSRGASWAHKDSRFMNWAAVKELKSILRVYNTVYGQ